MCNVSAVLLDSEKGTFAPEGTILPIPIAAKEGPSFLIPNTAAAHCRLAAQHLKS